MKDYSEEFKGIFEKFKGKGFEYGKPKEYLEFRNGSSIVEMEKDLLKLTNLEFIERQIKKGEKRYKLYFVYSKRRGRVYVLTFREKIRVITIYPLGPSTLRKFNREKF